MKTPRTLKIKGLKDGTYQIRVEGRELMQASAAELASGLTSTRLLANEQILKDIITEKNEQHFYSWRPQNTTYLFGFRKHEQGQNNKELSQFAPFVQDYETTITRLKKPSLLKWEIIPAPSRTARERKRQPESTVRPPDEELKTFRLPDDLEVSLFAAEPDIINPTHMNWDSQGRLWVACAPAYPQIKPGHLAEDQIVVLEDTDQDGRADKRHVFVDDAMIPTAVLPGNGGVYVGNSTELVHYRDTNGDMKADEKTVILSGFGTEDTHHIIHTLYWGQDGMMYFNQSIYIHSHVETPWGVERLMAGGIWQFNPNTHELKVFSRGLINTWGHQMDRFGRSFATDGAGSSGINYIFPGVAQRAAYGTSHMYPGLNPGQPKLCGLEIISGDHFPEKYQGLLVGNDFRGHRTVSFKVEELNSAFVSSQKADMITSGSGKLDRLGHGGGFRPIDAKMGPDGALYLADWSNIIIQHGEVDFRDKRRDQTHGRIWRVSAKGRSPLSYSDPNELSTIDLLEILDRNDRYRVDSAKRVLIERGASGVRPVLEKWLSGKRTDYQRLQALWLLCGLNSRDEALLASLIKSGDHRIRAAAIRIAALQYGNSKEIMKYCRLGIEDEHPLVRKETILALHSLGSADAVELALYALNRPLDPTIEYALTMVVRELAPQWVGNINFGKRIHHLLYAASTSGDTRVIDSIYKALSAGNIPKPEEEKALHLIAQLGTPQQLRTLYDKLFDENEKEASKLVILEGLNAAASKRRMKPSGDLNSLGDLISNSGLRSAAIRLAGTWKVPALTETISSLAVSGDPEAITAIGTLNPGKAKEILPQLVKDPPSSGADIAALVAMSRLNLAMASDLAVERFIANPTDTGYGAVFDAILRQKGGAERLQTSLTDRKINGNIALLGVRRANMMGLKAPKLIKTLNAAGDLKPMKQNLSKDEMAKMVASVRETGNPHFGEAIYRKPQLACMTCHAIGGAGPEIGPDLISIGASAPVDYLITSILNPNDKIKEGYHLTVVEKNDGEVVAGTEVSANKQEVVIRAATGERHVVKRQDIRKREISPASMMPPGLTASLSEEEFIHLISFLSQLGKEGDFKPPSERYVRSFKVIDHWKNEYWDTIHEQNWRPGFARISGAIPLKDGSVFNSGRPVVKIDFDVLKPGPITIELSTNEKIRAYSGNKEWVAINKDTRRLQVQVDKHNQSLVLLLNTGIKADELTIKIIENQSGAAFTLR